MTQNILFEITLGIESVAEVASMTANAIDHTNILLLNGDLGAGKTTFTQSLAMQLGVSGEITSPTFNIVNTLKTEDGKTIYHFDLYRIKHPEELIEIGFEEYLDSGNLCIIEWPERAEGFIQGEYLQLNIEHLGNQRHYRLLNKS